MDYDHGSKDSCDDVSATLGSDMLGGFPPTAQPRKKKKNKKSLFLVFITENALKVA